MPAATAGRADLDQLRALVSVAAALRAAGFEAEGERGRIACPLHAGSNASAFSYAPRVFYCHSCAAGGDVFSLTQALFTCDFRAAVARVALLAGLPADRLPRLGRAEVERQKTLARRRAALRRWRDARLIEWLGIIGHLANDEQRLLARYLDQARDQDDPDSHGWQLLASLHGDLETAECLVAALSVNDETAWASLWLLERRGGIELPDEIRGGPAPIPRALRK
jgi:hypothetical protein